MLVGVPLSVAEGPCPLCMDTFCCCSGSSWVRVRSDPTEWKQPTVEPSFISWSVQRKELGNVMLLLLQNQIVESTWRCSVTTYQSSGLCDQTQQPLCWYQWPEWRSRVWHRSGIHGRQKSYSRSSAQSLQPMIRGHNWRNCIPFVRRLY